MVAGCIVGPQLMNIGLDSFFSCDCCSSLICAKLITSFNVFGQNIRISSYIFDLSPSIKVPYQGVLCLSMHPATQFFKLFLVATQRARLLYSGQCFIEVLAFGWTKESPQFLHECFPFNDAPFFSVCPVQLLPPSVGFTFELKKGQRHLLLIRHLLVLEELCHSIKPFRWIIS